jgi:phage shock protein E
MDEIIKDLINDGAFLVDVRTLEEFAEGHAKNTVNIPLNDLLHNIELFENKPSVIVFCKSGGRSEMAKSLLEAKGIKNVINSGTWNYMDAVISSIE